MAKDSLRSAINKNVLDLYQAAHEMYFAHEQSMQEWKRIFREVPVEERSKVSLPTYGLHEKQKDLFRVVEKIQHEASMGDEEG